MYDADVIVPLRTRTVVTPEPAVRHASLTLTELAACLVIATTCVDMWLGIYTLVRCGIYSVAIVLAFAGSGFKPRFNAVGALLLLTGGQYMVKALLYPPVPNLVRNDIRNILVGFAFLTTLGISEPTSETWKHFQFRLHKTMLVMSTIGALLGLVKLVYYNQGGVIPYLMDAERGYPLGTSLTMDYNFYSLPLLLGLISAFWLMKTDYGTRWRTLALASVPFLILAVLFSGSRRGLIVLVCAVPILFAWLMFGRGEARRETRPAGMFWKVILTFAACAILFCILSLDSVSQTFRDVASADSLSDVLKRWETFQEGTYSDSRVYYWTITLQRLSHFGFLDYLFGQGFGYVTDLGADPDTVEDYPHNFLLSSMLYGGITQTCVLVIMVGVALRRLAFGAYRSMLALWFALVVFFLSTSCNSFFSSEIALFLTVLSFGLKPRQVA